MHEFGSMRLVALPDRLLYNNHESLGARYEAGGALLLAALLEMLRTAQNWSIKLYWPFRLEILGDMSILVFGVKQDQWGHDDDAIFENNVFG